MFPRFFLPFFSALTYFLVIDSRFCSAEAGSERQDFMSLGTRFDVDKLQKSVRKQVNELLGVTEIQRLIDRVSFERITFNDSVLHDLAVEIDKEFSKYTAALNKTHDFLTNCQVSSANCGCIMVSGFCIYPSLPECSTMLPNSLKYSEQYGTRVNVSYACSVLNEEAQRCEKNFHFGNLTSVFKANNRLNALRWQYVANTAGVQLEYPAHVFSSKRRRHWKPFLLSALPFKKRILILLDAGTVQTDAQLSKLKSISEILLDAASPGDRVMVMADVGFEVLTACSAEGFVETLDSNIAALSAFVNSLSLSTQHYNSFSHARALKAAYKLFVKDEKRLLEGDSFVTYYNVIFYVSRGVMSDLNETVSVLAALGEIAVQTNIRVKINTIAFSEGGRELMLWSASFLKNIAEQNYTKYKQSFPKILQDAINNAELVPPVGEAVIVNGSESSQLTLIKMYKLLSANWVSKSLGFDSSRIYWSHPFTESQSSMISISKVVWSSGGLAAVLGMDIVLDKFVNDLKNRDEVLMAHRDSLFHILICDYDGRVLIDSRLTRLNLWPIDISVLESWSVEDRYLSDVFLSDDVSGSFKLLKSNFNNATIEIKYNWIKLRSAPFVVVLARNALHDNFKYSLPIQKSFTKFAIREQCFHQQLYLKSDCLSQQCLHHGAVSNIRCGGFFLSPNCFDIYPSSKIFSSEWLCSPPFPFSENFRFYSEIELRRGVKEHVYALSGIIEIWKKIFSDHKNRIIRHYIATSKGVMLNYPATVVRPEYKPMLQPWYKKAVQYPGRIVFTGPTLDSKLGLVITISATIFEGLANSMHNAETDQIFAVAGMDMPVGFLLRLLRDNVPGCKERRRCILFDDVGYVLARGIETGLPVKELKLSGRNTLADAVERFHVNHLEPQLATHLIMNPSLVKKGQCIDWKLRSYGRLFQFNVTFKEFLTLPCGENGYSSSFRTRGVRAEVVAVPQTNVFLALMNENCAFAHQAFCPCSVLDRRCLLCSRFDDTECECPCQCPFYTSDFCSKSEYNFSSNYGEHAPLSSLLDLSVPDCAEKPTVFYSLSAESIAIKQCFAASCENYRTLDDCLLSVGCQWCATSENGEDPLEEPFCSSVDRCYGGVKGRKLKDAFGKAKQLVSQWSMATPVGAVAAGITSVFMIMVMAVYCYRSQVNRFVETRSLADSFDTPICPQLPDDGGFQFDYDENPDDKVQLASFEQRSNTRSIARPRLRPSPRTESSDQGYSTMTDRLGGEESEGASSSINITRRTERTFLMTPVGCIAEDCTNSLIVEADVHEIPSVLSAS